MCALLAFITKSLKYVSIDGSVMRRRSRKPWHV